MLALGPAVQRRAASDAISTGQSLQTEDVTILLQNQWVFFLLVFDVLSGGKSEVDGSVGCNAV
jgi:hypothetical protein